MIANDSDRLGLKGIIFLMAAAISGCGSSAPPGVTPRTVTSPTIDSRIVAMFGGAEGLAPVITPDKVEVYRIDGAHEGEIGTHEAIGRYPITAGPSLLVPSVAHRLTEILVDPANYGWDFAKGCLPTYGIAARFSKGGDTTDVLFCLSCNFMQVYRGSELVGGEDDDGARAKKLVQILKEVLPDDAEIQRLQAEP